MALTRAMCPPGSMDTEFVQGLAAVSGQLFKGNELVLTLKARFGLDALHDTAFVTAHGRRARCPRRR